MILIINTIYITFQIKAEHIDNSTHCVTFIGASSPLQTAGGVMFAYSYQNIRFWWPLDENIQTSWKPIEMSVSIWRTGKHGDVIQSVTV